MRLQGPWMEHVGTQAVCNMLKAAGFQALFVGGCVRNGLIGVRVSDIDIATDATPDVVCDLAENAGLRAVPTGIEHGTVTVIAQGKPHEVTTFRKDVETHGRHATVAFSTDIAEDAARRDFTMNALYASPDGEVLDPTGEGLADLSSRRLRFIGRAEDRIREDYLRILRFFRFHAWYADPENGLDPDGLSACAALSAGLETLSKERIGSEIKKLLSAPNPAPAVAAMAQTGVLIHALPGADACRLPILIDIEDAHDIPADPIRRLAALGGQSPESALRLSKAEGRRLSLIAEQIGTATGPMELGYRHGADDARDILMLRAASFERRLDPAELDDVARGAVALFPITAADLMPALSGPALGAKLKELENRWIASGFTLDRTALLS
ncbi:CCA tRNA nucleotidyltransferase [Rhodophyticola porphyridii]|uniref:CCA tRNA nucleotidyltransferase n=1 Tax=Rhodophyticola porphyridii TaxID=1852017 RepID=A0A3L9Y9H3_9RHOB|nr:CCA tRNA nucleotidyltransferase [Rhodophyticola porphyridii]RMA42716.1 CCA tRNA nucleotidyltransferase [Rhodophyticola porphyridii]